MYKAEESHYATIKVLVWFHCHLYAWWWFKMVTWLTFSLQATSFGEGWSSIIRNCWLGMSYKVMQITWLLFTHFVQSWISSYGNNGLYTSVIFKVLWSKYTCMFACLHLLKANTLQCSWRRLPPWICSGWVYDISNWLFDAVTIQQVAQLEVMSHLQVQTSIMIRL